MLSGSAQGFVRVEHGNNSAECIRFGIEDLNAALAAIHLDADSAEVATILVESLDQPVIDARRAPFEPAVPAAAESFAVRRSGSCLLIIGRDAVGAMYGALEVAEIVRNTGSLVKIPNLTQKPFLAFRAANQFLHEEALLDSHSWFYQETFWEGYFAQLARSRHNVLDLHGGYGLVRTNFPNLYPYFIHLDEFPGQSVGRSAANANLAMLNRIIELGNQHGVHVALMNYTVQGRKGEEKSEMFSGFDSERLARYTYLASLRLLSMCPDLWMFGFRIGESGQPEDFFQKTYLAAISDSGFRGKLYTRSWLATRKNIEAIKAGFSGDFYIQVKYNGEQLGPPYQAITSPSQFDPSYSYQDHTNLPRGYRLLYQVRANGTHRIFHWGDPGFVARVVKSCCLGDATGYSVEPMSAYYPMADQYHPRGGHHYFQWAWQRDWFWYELWGRLGYNPELSGQVFEAMFERRFGSVGPSLFKLVRTFSQVVSLVGSSIALGPDHRQWAPEFETGNPDFTQLNGLRAFGGIEGSLMVPAFDPMVMSSVSEAAGSEIRGDSSGRESPRDSALRLFSIAGAIDRQLERRFDIKKANEEADCLRQDAESLAALARFVGERYLCGLNLAKYQMTRYPKALTAAQHHLHLARAHWQRLASISDRHYGPLLDTLRMRTQAFRWESQMAIVDGDIARLSALEMERDNERSISPALRLSHLPDHCEEMTRFLPRAATLPVQWRESSFEAVSLDGHDALRSFGGRLGFDVEDLILHDTDADVSLDLAYWDPGPGHHGKIAIEYDGVDRPFGELVDGTAIVLGGHRGWHHTTIDLQRVRFAGGGPGFADIVLTASGGAEVIVEKPALTVTRLPAPRLELHVANAVRSPPKYATIHWREPGGVWQEAGLTRGVGEPDIELVPIGREYYRYSIPAYIDVLEYYFTATSSDLTSRLPADGGSYRWVRQGETDPPIIVSEPLATRPTLEGLVHLHASVTDPSGVARVRLFFKPIPSEKVWQSMEMSAGAGRDEFEATVPLTSEGLLYRIVAWDRRGNSAGYPDFHIETPYRIIPSWDSTTNQDEK
ncbi:MAG: hypothetical protein KBA71_10865 [Opitutaceae bacterium]|nr:hypothetical protein [Opitutaceae bacterium]